MKAASIRYRVADFLRQHPPFQYMQEEDLLDLVSEGRVKFHEAEELIFEQGQTRGPYLFVIQQGTVQLFVRTEKGEELRDLLGEGDLLGVGRFLGAPTHRQSARTRSDVILYSIPAADFDKLTGKYPPVSRYLAAYLSVSSSDAAVRPGASGSGLWLDRPGPAREAARGHLVTCAPEVAIQAAARMMSGQSSAIVVVNPNGRPLGVITERDLLDRLAGRTFSADMPAGKIMHSRFATALADLRTGDYVLEMMRAGTNCVVLTEDGSADSAAVAMVTEADLILMCGHHPQETARRIAKAGNVAELAELRSNAETMLATHLSGPAAIDWFLPLMSEINSALLLRLAKLAAADLTAAHLAAPQLDYCWVWFGEAGRRELLIRKNLLYGLIYEDPPPGTEAAAHSYFSELMRRVSAGVTRCGFTVVNRQLAIGHQLAIEPQLAITADTCLPISAWQELYAGWVRDPIMNEAYEALAFFDVAPVSRNASLAHRLGESIKALVRENSNFVSLLANDSLANLPPLTFFRGLVVEDGSTQSDSLQLVRCALQPLTDMGRVFAAASGRIGGESTLDRLAAVGNADGIAQAAQEAFRVALFHRTTTALREGTDGSVLNPSHLGKYDQQLLKGAFRSILALLELTAVRFHFSGAA